MIFMICFKALYLETVARVTKHKAEEMCIFFRGRNV